MQVKDISMRDYRPRHAILTGLCKEIIPKLKEDTNMPANFYTHYAERVRK